MSSIAHPGPYGSGAKRVPSIRTVPFIFRSPAS